MDINKYKDMHIIHIYEDMLKYVDIFIFGYICIFMDIAKYNGYP